ncbi:MAG: alkaline phosphatase [Anaerolineales bacterium]|nr:alkaline phosphatase [Anaerolineales bacterium]
MSNTGPKKRQNIRYIVIIIIILIVILFAILLVIPNVLFKEGSARPKPTATHTTPTLIAITSPTLTTAPTKIIPTATHILPKARNVILFIGDGMGEGHRLGASWLAVGDTGTLTMDSLPVSGIADPRSVDLRVVDSASSATAMATGVKTLNDRIAVDRDGNPLQTILEMSQVCGKATGLVTNVQLSHATPAVFAAHVRNRGDMIEISRQMMETGVDVLLGGGEDEFLPKGVPGCHPETGERRDGLNLVEDAIEAGYELVCDAESLAKVPSSTTHLLGFFADEGMKRPYSPSLAEMTTKAIDILSQDPEGFFLMVEGGQIDWASHDNDSEDTLMDVIGFDEAVAVAVSFADSDGETLVIVTADHETGGLAVSQSSENMGAWFEEFSMPDGTPFYLGWSSTSHTRAAIPTTAMGPGSDGLAGRYESTHIFKVMRDAFGVAGCSVGD